MRLKLLFLVLLCTQFATARQIDTIPMVWTENHSALLLPVSIAGHPSGYMQFDLGAPNTLLYKKAMPGQGDTLRDFSFRVGKMLFSPGPVAIKAVDAGEKIMGTLGADFIANRLVIFDYPHRQLLLADSLPEQFNIPLQPFYFPGRRVLLPVTLRGKQTIMYFDTGSSAFALITDSTSWGQLAVKDSTAFSYPVNSWGRTLTAHVIASADSMLLAGRNIPLGRVAYISGASDAQVQQMRQMGIGGMIGNALFLKSVLILDTKRQRFGVQ